VNTLYSLEEWRSEQRIFTPGANITPRGTHFAPGDLLYFASAGKVRKNETPKISDKNNHIFKIGEAYKLFLIVLYIRPNFGILDVNRPKICLHKPQILYKVMPDGTNFRSHDTK
jgi:hypothetical protein